MRASASGRQVWRPEALLYALVMESPQEIDLNTIARFCGARIKYRSLSGCAAKLVGANDMAIITVDRDAHPRRQRFSIGHELGHWMCDRDADVFECAPRAFSEEWTAENPETRANRFASELLMPESMFKELASRLMPGFGAIQNLARKFQTSVIATAIRYVELSAERHFLLCACRKGRRTWFVRSPGLSPRLFPLERPTSADVALVLRGREPAQGATRGGSVWFASAQARQSTLFEETIRIGRGGQESLSLLSWPDVQSELGCA